MMRLVSLFCLLAPVAVAGPVLPETLHNVGVARVLYPVGAIDSGIPITPKVLVRNYGTSDESLSVTMLFEDGWMDVVEIPLLAALSEDTVEFSQWTPQWPDSMSACSWTECPSDPYPEDDTAWTRFLVRLIQVGMEPGGVPDTLESAAVYRPRRWVYNRGNVPVQVNLVFSIVGQFRSVAQSNVPPGGRREVVAPDSWVARPGVWLVVDSLIVPQDTLVIVLTDTLVVTGAVRHDLGVTAITAPSGQVDTVTLVIPSAEITNFGPRPETCMVWLWVTGPARETVYVDSVPAIVQVTRTVTFRPTRFRTLGPHEAVCSLYCRRDEEPMNNLFRQPFEVVPLRRPDIRLVYAGAERDTVDTMMPVQPIARLKNFGNALDSGRVWMFISDPFLDSLVYADSQGFFLGPGQEERFAFRSQIFRVPGVYDGLCRFRASQGSEDSATWRLVVIPGAGIGDVGGGIPGVRNTATVVAGTLWLEMPGEFVQGSLIELWDGNGRRAARLHVGANDIRGLAPGIYFARAVKGSGQRVMKLIVQH